VDEDHLDEEPVYPIKCLSKINLKDYAFQILRFNRMDGFLGCAYGFMDLPVVEKCKLLKGNMVGEYGTKLI